MGRDLAEVAQALGYRGLLMGIWDPRSTDEREQAMACKDLPVVFGYIVGNEGYRKRYSLDDLRSAIDTIRAATGKPTTTSEEIDDYTDKGLRDIGDFVCANVHPFYHNKPGVEDAVNFTVGAYRELSQQAKRTVFFKEVGLPTAGVRGVSEQAQLLYYQSLERKRADGKVQFAYFEAFDLASKVDTPVEPHWGLFKVRLAQGGGLEAVPKPLGRELLDHNRGVRLPDDAGQMLPTSARSMMSVDSLYVASGITGDVGDVKVGAGGEGAVAISYRPQGRGPHEWDFKYVSNEEIARPARHGGATWLSPPGHWGDSPSGGYDLRPLQPVAITFEARSTGPPVWVHFSAGGVRWRWRLDPWRHWVRSEVLYPDTLPPIYLGTYPLSNNWQKVTCRLPLLSPDQLRRVVGAFSTAVAWAENGLGPDPATHPRAADFQFEVRKIQYLSAAAAPADLPLPRHGTFAVYTDAAAPDNHFVPSGLMGDMGDVAVNTACPLLPHSGKTCISLTYAAKGLEPRSPHDYPGPCRWAGVYFQHPANNAGADAHWAGVGFDLSAYSRVEFFARADRPCLVEFLVAGQTGPYGDSQAFPRKKAFSLGTEYAPYVIELDGTDLSHTIGGFGAVLTMDNNKEAVTIYMDDISYKR